MLLVVAVAVGLVAAQGPARAATAAPRTTGPTHVAPWGTSQAASPGLPRSAPMIRAGAIAGAGRRSFDATSSNWSGYIEQGSSFTSISGDWIVPSVVPSVGAESSGTWIGIDGVSATSLIQTGTGQDTQNGQTSYYAWFEVLPSPATVIGGVSPGDHMHAQITETAPGSDTWTILIQDLTSGNSLNPSGTYFTPGESADWIEEAPTGPGGLLTLADYGTVQFSNLTVDGVQPPAASLQAVDMINATNAVISQPAPYNAGTNSFSVSYVNGSSPTTTTTTPGSTTTTPSPTGGCTAPADHAVSGQPVAIAAMRSANGCLGYWVVSAQGQVVAFGAAQPYGDLSAVAHPPVVAIIASPTGLGYWLATADGRVYGYGDAVSVGDLAGHHLNGSIIAMAATADGKGYWLVGSDGGIFTFGDAHFFGSTGATHLNRPVVGIAAAPGDAGYWLVASDGGVFAFGTAGFLGSMGGTHLNRPVVGLTADPAGHGYRMVGADGGIFSFGAPFYGSLGSTPPAAGVRTMAPSTDGGGYYLLAGDGGVYGFGDAGYLGRA